MEKIVIVTERIYHGNESLIIGDDISSEDAQSLINKYDNNKLNPTDDFDSISLLEDMLIDKPKAGDFVSVRVLHFKKINDIWVPQ